MTALIELRTRIRQLISKQEGWVNGAFRFALSLAALLMVNNSLGYQPILCHWWVAVAIAFICAFIQMQGTTVIVIFYTLLQLMTLSTDVAAAALILIVVSYGVCAYFQSRDTYNFLTIPLCYHMNIPFMMPMAAGLSGGIYELPSVLFGSVVSYFLHTVSQNASLFLEANSEMSASILIQTKLLTSPMFYIYIATMCGVFILAYYIRTSKVKYAWFVAVMAAVMASFVAMLATHLFIEGRGGIPSLVIGSIVTLVLGVVMTFFVQGVDYNRTEKVIYEDDEYIYYVTAVPKVHVAEQEKEVKKITERKE